METRKFKYEELNYADLYIDAIYMSPRPAKNGRANDVLTKLLNVGNSGGFRAKSGKSYLVLYLTGYNPAWPDVFDTETGILTYYGDNTEGGIDVDSKRGNRLLHEIFDDLANKQYHKIPPILIFQNTKEESDVKFLGLAVPGVPNIHADEYFSTVWRTQKGVRFPNYVAKFTVIKLKEGQCIKRQWLNALAEKSDEAMELAPLAWKNFVRRGLIGIEPLAAPKVEYPKKKEMLPADEEGMNILKIIHRKYGRENSVGFEKFCKKLMYLMDPNFQNINLTRPWKDGGMDAFAEYVIKATSDSEKLIVECAMEAKCFNPEKNGVQVRQTARLISRIRHRQFGIFITTSYIADQAYKEVKEDGHPILFCTGKDIVKILKEKAGVTSKNISEWLDKNVE